MKKITIIVAALVIVAAIGVIACNSSQSRPKNKEGISNTTVSKDSLIKRGKYLVAIMGCHDCHSPNIMTPIGPAKDTTRLLSGHPSNITLPKFNKDYTKLWALFSLTGTAMAGPWGVSYAANLTSDATGIGNWTEQQFFKAIREGKFKGLDNARTLLPPMPWPIYGKASDEDLRAIFAYLKSTPPVNNVVPEPIAAALAKK